MANKRDVRLVHNRVIINTKEVGTGSADAKFAAAQTRL